MSAREDQFNKLEGLQDLYIRFIFELQNYDHVSDYREKLKWWLIRLRRNTHVLSLLYNIVLNPQITIHFLTRLTSQIAEVVREPEAENAWPFYYYYLDLPKFFEHFFCVQAVRLWNALPIRPAQTLTVFKRQVKKQYLRDINVAQPAIYF